MNCAGLLYTDHFEDQPSERIAQLLAVNNLGVADCCQAALPLLKQSVRNGGRPSFVNLSSASAVFGIPSMAVYSASKFWVRGFTEALAGEWASHGKAVRDVMPPFLRTPMLHASADNPFVKTLGVDLSPEAVARQVLAAADSGPLHRLVSFRFKALLLFCKLITDFLVRTALARIAGRNPA